MWQRTEHDSSGEELFLAGEKVRPGIYRQVGGSREILLENEDILPASLDGRVACYMRVQPWEQMAQQRTPRV
jgi:hypothetical protein